MARLPPLLSWFVTAAWFGAARLQVLATPSVNVALEASFPAAPYLLELIETAANENATAYFPLLDRIATGSFSSADTHEGLYNAVLAALREDGHVSCPESLSLFKLSLALRTAAPRIEAHYQYYTTAIQSSPDEDCRTWALRAGQRFCDPELKGGSDVEASFKDLPFDRVMGSGEEIILYADVLSPEFGQFHQSLVMKARANQISYRIRYTRSPTVPGTPIAVSGYGVELALKRTDYIVIDDREPSSPPAGSRGDAQQAVLGANDDDLADLKPLSSSELSTLGIRAASFVMRSDNPLDTLVRLARDLPKFSSLIAASDIDEDFLREHQHNRALVAPNGANVLWLNGIQLIERQIEPFNLLDMLRRERRLIGTVRSLGFSGKEAIDLLGHDKISGSRTEGSQWRFDWRDEKEGGNVILWLNDLESDAMYSGYPSSLSSLFQRVYPGQIPPIRRNVWNLVVPVDYSSRQDFELIMQLRMFVSRGLPLRFGLTPLVANEAAVGQTKVVNYLTQAYGIPSAMRYLENYQGQLSVGPDAPSFKLATEDQELLPGSSVLSLDEVLNSHDFADRVESARQWSRRLNAETTVPPVFINGRPIQRSGEWLQAMSMGLSEDLKTIQQAIIGGQIEEDSSLSGLFLEDAMSRRNSHVFPPDAKSLRIVNVNKLYVDHAGLLGSALVLDSDSEVSKENWAALTVVADLETWSGLDIFISALELRRNNPGVRLEVLHNPQSAPSPSASPCPLAALKSQKNLLLLHGTDPDTLVGLIKSAPEFVTEDYVSGISRFLGEVAMQPGDKFLILNGRLVGAFAPGDEFSQDDMQLLLEVDAKERLLPVVAALSDSGLGSKLGDPLAAAKLISITALSMTSDLPEGIFESSATRRSNFISSLNAKHSAIEVGDATTASIHLVCLLNLASEQGQRWAPILKVLSELDGVYLKLFLNPEDRITDLPVKRFFRYVFESAPRFDEAGALMSPRATFNGLPSEALLTAGMDVPPAWLVAPKASIQDLDNIKLSSVRGDIEATYELKSILIEGHSRETKGTAPRGVQLVLGTEMDANLQDTIVMANIGFFQFKANPGIYSIHLKAGKSTQVFDIESVGAHGWQPVSGDEGCDVSLITFQGTTLYPRLRRKPGMETVDVLDDATSDGDSIASRGRKLASGLFGTKRKSPSEEAHAEINIFSVASGHLYERMLNIMMVSVMKNTKHTVKFWFIEQFLSPSFKEFIPHLAAEYGFRYEMVTYKWPHWLRGQKEKQREIWGYKILFLDVLFPLSLDKVIFVDADQIVRTDMIGLVNHDLQGAPYGFTPMCDSRTEMEGFRFWKQGYWANYLRGLPYHISALYVVDLRRFRAVAAGDRLRQQYHALSADPASLSNLDQDLPNHMQFQIPIHSLPQEWLWCETWCSDESLASAKTIDLCNNPLTKEPKLERARRQVPEWTVYDEEIAALHQKRTMVGRETGLPSSVEEDATQRNPKSRRLDYTVGDTEETEAARIKDEL